MKIIDYSQIKNSVTSQEHNTTLETITAALIFIVPALLLLAIAAK